MSYKNIFPAAVLVLFATSACRKTVNNPPTGNIDSAVFGLSSFTPIPAAAPVNTAITAYYDEMINDPTYETNWYIAAAPPTIPQGVALTNTGFLFFMAASNLDEYNTHFLGIENDPTYLNTNVIVPVTPSIRNYVGMHRVLINFPNPPGGFDPTGNTFGALLPSPLVDSAGQRWFLASYGANYTVVVRESVNSQYGPLGIAIPAALVAAAPDTIGSWLYNNTTNTWQQSGYAVKSGNFYQKAFYQAGLWNTGLTVPGKYLTIHLRADDSATVANTRVVVTGKGISVAEGTTDADGNLICFVPTGWPLSISTYQTPTYSNIMTYSAQLPSIYLNDEVTVNIRRASNNYLSTISGTVYTCDGSLLPEGILNLAFYNDGPGIVDYYVPIKNGRYSTGIWLPGSFFTAQITDMGGNPLGDATSVNIPFRGGIPYTYTLSTCPNSTQLYANSTIDNQPVYTQLDDASSSSPYLTADQPLSAYYTRINAMKNGKGFQFTGDFYPGIYSVGGTMTLYAENLSINGVSYPVDFSVNPALNIIRYDNNVNGLIEGVVGLNYLDTAGVSHLFVANFKVRRNF
jgi:hypothetical protein